MSLNWREIDAVLDELPLAGAYLQKIKQPDYSSLLWEVYSQNEPFTLFFGLSPGLVRLHRLDQPLKTRIKLQRFAQFARSRVGGGRIIEAEQQGAERLVKFVVSKAGAITVLWARLWSNAANIIATDQKNRVLDLFYRRPKQNEISGAFFNPWPSKRQAVKSTSSYENRFTGQDSVNRQIALFYAKLETEQRCQKMAGLAQKIITARLTHLTSTLKKLKARQSEDREAVVWKQYGDLIMSQAWRIDPGADWLSTNDYFNDNKQVEIQLEPNLNPFENAQKYYRRHRKTAVRQDRLSSDIEAITSREKWWREQSAILEKGADSAWLENFLAQNAAQKDRKPARPEAGMRFSSQGFTLLVGRGARENEALLRHSVRGNDYWLHARDFPGAYVFIKAQINKSVPLPVLLDAGNLALYYSKKRADGRADLYFTQVKYLKKIKGGRPGRVLPTREKNLHIVLDQNRLRKLFGQSE